MSRPTSIPGRLRSQRLILLMGLLAPLQIAAAQELSSSGETNSLQQPSVECTANQATALNLIKDGSVSDNAANPQATPAASITQPLPEEAAKVRESPDSVSPSSDLRLPSRRSAHRNDVAGGPSASEPTPWYRTGLGALTIVVVAIAVVFLLARRWLPGARMTDSTVMRVVARSSISPRQQLTLVRVGRRLVMLGVSAERVDRLCEITDEAEVAELDARTGSASRFRAGPFTEHLRSASQQFISSAETDGGAKCEPNSRDVPRAFGDLMRKLKTLQSG